MSYYDDLSHALNRVGEVPCQNAPDLFFPEKIGTEGNLGQSVKLAKKACATCPALNPCLAYALAANETDGIWGGTSPNERQELRRRSATPVCA